RSFSVVILPRPPSSTLFPYTTLFRSGRGGAGLWFWHGGHFRHPAGAGAQRHCLRRGFVRRHAGTAETVPAAGYSGDLITERTARSEEHTSELQSRENLVCRLLLEKKK